MTTLDRITASRFFSFAIQDETAPRPRIQKRPNQAGKSYAINFDANTSADAVVIQAALAAEFKLLADRWEEEVVGYSMIRDMVSHPAYRQILKRGDDYLPFILARLRDRGGFWFGALYEITKEDPVPDEDAGDRDKMTSAWIRWGRDNARLPS